MVINPALAALARGSRNRPQWSVCSGCPPTLALAIHSRSFTIVFRVDGTIIPNVGGTERTISQGHLGVPVNLSTPCLSIAPHRGRTSRRGSGSLRFAIICRGTLRPDGPGHVTQRGDTAIRPVVFRSWKNRHLVVLVRRLCGGHRVVGMTMVFELSSSFI